MKEYLAPFLVYILTLPILNFFLKDVYLVYVIEIILVGLLLLYFRKQYQIKLKLDLLIFLVGFLIFVVWIGLEGFYPLLMKSEFVPPNIFYLIFKLLVTITAVPIIEELFTRGFLIRYFTAKNWKEVPIGKFTWTSFTITVLFFGFSHNRWLPGLIVGILLNLLLYKTKNLGNCIFAHSLANLLLGIYVIYTQSWFLW